MLTLPLWLTAYLSIGFLTVLWCRKDIANSARPHLAGSSGPRLSFMCAYLVMFFGLIWPYVVARVVAAMVRAGVKVVRDAPPPRGNLRPGGGYQPHPSGKAWGRPPGGGSSGRRPKR